MILKHKLLIAGTTAVLGLGSLGVVGMANAQTDSGTSLIDKITSTFHLNRADVQKVFDQQHQENQASHQAQEKTRLDQAVKDGKLTLDQENKIIAKQAELEKNHRAERDDRQSQTPAERRAEMDSQRTELQQWAKDNNIPIEYLMGFGGPRGHRGGRGGPPTN